ncbi:MULTISPECIES: TonB-dependent receptor [Zobellia]|uniref:TonB-dependent Receptor n=1 Tax=Zobellia galactanivorans (strain DSM 12802 / CCUG 47099 / CIP 106680 / NCIMB 13871 / Dsij) TaxID=63186 RepID=G0LAQ5_ZOBGA|nr:MULTISPECIES: TonB-dependent receptor [Zobellia]MBU3028043.1 TonB-dependent receptor [Zobellia galactanivorans]OWW26548.1 TonB-dependent receptor [Zobellia sp. OII3]CAZ95493.1 TonB-dependent Receptor [Zobellia galactanivorans]
MKKMYFAWVAFLMTTIAFSQGTITGTVIDGELNEPLPGASVVLQGTTNGTSTDFDGQFKIETTKNTGTLLVSYIGYTSKKVAFTSAGDIGRIVLEPDAEQLGEVVVIGTGIIDLANDRETPIAVSSIPAKQIQEKIGTQDITMTMVNTPSVYVAGQSSGYGDSRMSVRGFGQDNTAFLLNGQPINGMEDGLMYWSNWSGLADIANGVQIQRGLGSSKLAISSVGGTVNFVTKATDKKEGGFASFGMANDSYYKGTLGYSTGMNENGFGVSVMLSHWQGNGYNDGTEGYGQNYFISFGYAPSDRHNLNFLLTGAPQYHDQNYSKPISTYLEYGRKYNNNYGYLGDKFISERGNYYHKPVANLNWDFDINDKSQLSTVLYASWGRGGSVGNVGSRVRTEDGYINWGAIVANNEASADGSSTYALRNSVNNHSWYGLVTNYNLELSDNLDWNVGFDLRTYKGSHFRQIHDLLGADYFEDNGNVRYPSGNQITATFKANPWSALTNYADEGERYAWDYDERINYGGIFTQLEYAVDDFSLFVQGAASSQSHVRWDRYQYDEANEESEKVTNPGFNVKAGGSYKIDGVHSIYANTGYYSRQPYHDNIYLNFGNEINPLTENEKIFGLEAGYGLRLNNFSANINLYRTSWEDRVVTSATTDDITGEQIYTSNYGVKQLHSGIEIDAKGHINQLMLRGFLSIGNWEYSGDSRTVVRDEDRNLLSEVTEDVDGGKVGDAAQLTFGLGADYQILENFSADADYRFYDKLYADVGAVKENLELPSFGILDLGATYNFPISAENNLSLRVNVNNALHKIYISELTSADLPVAGEQTYDGIALSNYAYFGLGRTWNVSLRYSF